MSAGASFDAAVVGGGIDGLAAAAVLGRAGLRVVVLERDAALGGRARSLEFAPGFRAAPLDLDAGWVPPAAARGAGLAVPDLVPCEAPVTVVVEPGACLTLWRDPARAAETVRRRSARDAAAWPAFAARLRRLAGFLEALYQEPPPDVEAASLRDLPPLLALARRFRALGREDMTGMLRILPMPIRDLLDDVFESDAVKAAVAPGGVQDLRQGPRSGGTAFLLLHHLTGAPAGSVRGRGRRRGGPEALVRAAEEAARRAGAVIRSGAEVVRIEVKDDAVAGAVLTGGEEIRTGRIVSTADPARTILGFLDPVWLDPEFLHAVRQIKYRGCAAFVLYALDALPAVAGLEAPEALGGLVSLTPSVEALDRAADAAKYGAASERPHVEVTVPTLHAPEAAPAGRHVLVARAQYAPYRLRDGAWDAARREALAEAVTRAIEDAAPGFGSKVLHRAVLTPREIEETYGLAEGAATHGQVSLDQILFMRPVAGWGRYAMPIQGLYMGGAGAHPGPGIPGGAGWLAARRLLADRRR
jgi:phytoene dehydrogenase-like protein